MGQVILQELPCGFSDGRNSDGNYFIVLRDKYFFIATNRNIRINNKLDFITYVCRRLST